MKACLPESKTIVNIDMYMAGRQTGGLVENRHIESIIKTNININMFMIGSQTGEQVDKLKALDHILDFDMCAGRKVDMWKMYTDWHNNVTFNLVQPYLFKLKKA